MRKFRHKKTGTIAEPAMSKDHYNTISKDLEYRNHIHKDFIEDCKDWEEIIEKDYEILSFRIKKGVFLHEAERIIRAPFPGYTENDYNKETSPWSIHSIKRSLDGEIFTIGDHAKFLSHHGGQEIVSFYIDRLDRMVVKLTASEYLLESISKCKEILCTTIDGVNIYDLKSEVFELFLNSFIVNYNIPFNATNVYLKIKSPVLLFSSREAVDEYIIMNKPCLSIKDIENMLEIKSNKLHKCTFKEFLKEIVKSKLR